MKLLPKAAALALVAAALLALAGCDATKRPAGSSLPREQARRMATAAALLSNGKVYSVAATGSMWPTFDERAFVVLEPCQLAQIQPGDIIVRRLAGREVVHRVIRAGSAVQTQGDACANPDPGDVAAEDLIGRAVCVVWSHEPPATNPEK